MKFSAETVKAIEREIAEGRATVTNHPPAPPEECSEKVFQAAVRCRAKELGWKCYHTFDSRRSDKGFPDLVLVRERILFVELKTEVGKTTAEQDNWRDWLNTGGGLTYLWRPSDWQAIEEVLQ